MPNTWPINLSTKPLAGTYSEPGDDALARSEMGVGAPRQYRMYTKAVKYVSGTWDLYVTEGDDQVQTLMDFFEETCKLGQEEFDMPHPRTDVTTEFFFQNRPVPQHVIGTRWQVPLVLRLK